MTARPSHESPLGFESSLGPAKGLSISATMRESSKIPHSISLISNMTKAAYRNCVKYG